MSIDYVRIAALVCLVLGLAWIALRAGRVAAHLRQFMFEPSSPFNLGALRAIVFAVIFKLALTSKASFFASLPAGLRSLPPGWGWADGVLPFDEPSARFARLALLIMSALASVGLASRITAPLASLLALYVLGLPNFYFKVDHSAHILMMCALVIGVSACGDGFALDQFWKRRRGPVATASPVYTIPVRFCWLLMGTVYLFPGLWKLWESGDRWMSGYQLLAEMYAKWGLREHFTPLARIDHYPWLLAMLGIATLVFEIGFFFALFNRYTRVLAAFSAVGFHLGVLSFMGIEFHTFFPLVLLLDFPQLALLIGQHLPARARAWLDARMGTSASPDAAPRTVAAAAPTTGWLLRGGARMPFLIGALLLGLQFMTGFGRINTWPVSVHPTFSSRQHVVRKRVSRATMVVEPAGGNPVQELPDSMSEDFGFARLTKLLVKVKQVASRQKYQRDSHMLVELLRHFDVRVEPGDAIAVYDAQWDVFPIGEHRHYRRTLIERFRVQDDLTLRGELRAARDEKRAQATAEPESDAPDTSPSKPEAQEQAPDE